MRRARPRPAARRAPAQPVSPDARTWEQHTKHVTASARASAAIVAVGLTVLGLSFVPGWIEHSRVVLGEGPRTIATPISAWELQSWPVVSAAVIADTVLAALALARLGRPSIVRSGWLAGLALIALGLLLGAAWPVSQEGHTSSVSLTAGWPLVVSVAANAGVLIAMLGTTPLRRTVIPVAALAVLSMAGLTAGGRILQLNLAEGSDQHWTDGSYTRLATAGQPTETLTLRNETYMVDDRWSGRLEADGLVVVLTGDPVCPAARGTYRVWSAGGADIRWEMIVDTCAGGARARDLQAGIWARSP
jgi:hypothetical protein